ncbi:tryptophan synthase subunit alpha [Sphingosinicella ginsenosidimutans]|uniref:Tryptophan synthase alpha chain n=1 Tax=Allosphingosinicella ginsenosidimutans TaxID=1176539 RepID=A0A5C6TQT2_9SPHN|nr:tryptophan synthase subunit alpha [Sphingosinicella ginsenosidimutans]TXC62724.1 tryptophan synthase subunit alpha [Sphingosinicella ginsenosidimutans]
MSRYAAIFRRNEGAFGAFVMLGDPDLETSARILDTLVEGGADMIEVGIPFSDPVADGPVIQAAAVRALEKGVTPADCFALLGAFRARHADVPVGILTYANLVVARGRDAFYRAAAEAGVDSVLVADVPEIEAAPFAQAARAAGIDPVLIAAANTPDDRIARIAALGGGYTYCVTRAGITGADQAVRFDHAALIDALARNGAPPPVFGFGISKPDHVAAALAAGAAGAISGSAIVQRIADHPDDPAGAVRSFVAAMKGATRIREAVQG